LRKEAIIEANQETRESFEAMRELDVLYIGGIPSSFFAGLSSQAADEAVGKMAGRFGFVMASTTKVVDKVFAHGRGSSGLVKFAMPNSVTEAIEHGLSVTDRDSVVHLNLKHGPTDDVFDRINLRHLDLMARGQEEHAAAYRAEALKHHEELGDTGH